MRQADAGGLPRGAALPALLLLAAAAALAPGAHAAPTPAVPADAYLNADGLPLLMPTNRTTDKRRWYYELPRNPGGGSVPQHCACCWRLHLAACRL